jgi:hypothetical protein
MPFGMFNSPSTFQILINHVFHYFLCSFVLVFFNDILIYSKTYPIDLSHVDQVLHLLSQHQFFLKQSKCSFGSLEVEYLVHIVGEDGVRVDLKQIEAMQDWTCPKTLKSFHGFLGLMGYYCKYVNLYGKITSPLTSLIKNSYFNWTHAAHQAFHALKEAMCTTPLLALLDFKRTFVVEYVASEK